MNEEIWLRCRKFKDVSIDQCEITNKKFNKTIYAENNKPLNVLQGTNKTDPSMLNLETQSKCLRSVHEVAVAVGHSVWVEHEFSKKLQKGKTPRRQDILHGERNK